MVKIQKRFVAVILALLLFVSNNYFYATNTPVVEVSPEELNNTNTPVVEISEEELNNNTSNQTDSDSIDFNVIYSAFVGVFDEYVVDPLKPIGDDLYNTGVFIGNAFGEAGDKLGSIFDSAFNVPSSQTQTNQQTGTTGNIEYEESTAGSGFDPSLIPGNETVDANVQRVGKNITATVLTVLQVAAFAGIIIAGLRYMYSSADQRADIKTGMITLCVGMILVFGASTVAKVATDAFTEIAEGNWTTIKRGVNTYYYSEYTTNDTCNGEVINKTFKFGEEGGVYYCTSSGYCCSLKNGEYNLLGKEEYAADLALLDSKYVKISVKIPDPNYYEKEICSETGDKKEVFVGNKGDTRKVTMELFVYGNNKGHVYSVHDGKGSTYTGSYSVIDGKIYRETGNCKGQQYRELVYDSKGALLYENINVDD